VAATLEKQAKHWTYEEYYKLEDDQRYEIINGNLVMAPAPTLWHQDWLGDLYSLVKSFVKKNNLGRLFIAPVDVVLDEENTVQPDLVFVAANNARIMQPRAIFGTPDLLVELVSPSSVRRDPHEKMKLYARFRSQGILDWQCRQPLAGNPHFDEMAGTNFICVRRGKGQASVPWF
jgi:Uma2 family endonuclease